jgi:hypothetical protein
MTDGNKLIMTKLKIKRNKNEPELHNLDHNPQTTSQNEIHGQCLQMCKDKGANLTIMTNGCTSGDNLEQRRVRGKK